MRRIGSWLAIILALVMISTVTIFDPADITRTVLLKIIPERKIPQTEGVIARVTFDRPLIPGTTVLEVSGVRDNANFLMEPAPPEVRTVKGQAGLVKPVKLVGVRAYPDKDGVRIDAIFSKAVVEADARKVENYSISAVGKAVDLTGAKVSYDPSTHETAILLPAGRLKAGDEFIIKVSNVRDITGTAIKAGAGTKGVVAPELVITKLVSAKQNLSVDKSGRTIDLLFSDRLDRQFAEEPQNYIVEVTKHAEEAKLLPGGKAVRVRFGDEIVAGESTLCVKNLLDARGVWTKFVAAQSIEPESKQPPKVVSIEVTSVPDASNDTIMMKFDKTLVKDAAEDIANYTLESPEGNELDISDATVAYDAEAGTVTLTLGSANLITGESYVLRVAGIKDVCGNTVSKPLVLKGKVVGDDTPPAVKEVKQNLFRDSMGSTVDVFFTEDVDEESVIDAEKYSDSAGQKPYLVRKFTGNGVRLSFEKPVIPGETTLNLRDIRDFAGNVLEEATGLAIVPDDLKPPRVIRAKLALRPGPNNDVLSISFSEPVIERDALNRDNYLLETPDGGKISLKDTLIRYDPATRTVSMRFIGKGEEAVNFAALKATEGAYRITVSNIRDISGNSIPPNTVERILISGDSLPPGVKAVLWDPEKDPTRTMVFLRFSEPIDREIFAKKTKFTFSSGLKLTEAPQLLADSQTVRLKVDKPVRLAKPRGLLVLAALVIIFGAMFLLGTERNLPDTIRPLARAGTTVLAALLLLGVFLIGKSKTTVVVSEIRDLAGNISTSVKSPPVRKLKAPAPRVQSARMRKLRGEGNFELSIAFTQPVLPAEAENPNNIKLTVKGGRAIDITKNLILYEYSDNMTRILLHEPELRVGDNFTVTVANVGDVFGRKISKAQLSGKVEGDDTPPRVVSIKQNLKITTVELKEEIEEIANIKGFGTGGTAVVDVLFSEPLDPYTAQCRANYCFKEGQDVKIALLRKDGRTVRLVVKESPAQVTPGEAKVTIRNVEDLAGNVMKTVYDADIAPFYKGAPRVLSVQANAVPGRYNDTIIVSFDRKVVTKTVTDVNNYRLESPIGKEIDLSSASISYNAPSATATITLSGKGEHAVDLHASDSFKLTITGVKDISGNPIKPNTMMKGTVHGDSSPPRLIAVIQNIAIDPTGRTVDVQFDESISEESAMRLENYAASEGQKPIAVEIADVPPPPVEQEVLDAIATIRDEDIENLIRTFTSFPRKSPTKSRVPGYGGAAEAKDFIVGYFKQLGLEPKVDQFRVPVPVEKGQSRLIIDKTGEKINIYCVWPNKVKTSTTGRKGIRGHLVYGGKGRYEDYDGKEMEGSIVLMDFGCWQDYLNARMLGAKAIIFFDNGDVDMAQAAEKYITVPADIPRYYVQRKDAEKLLKLCDKGETVTIFARMDWENVPAYNIYAKLEGSDELMPPVPGEEPKRWKDEMIVVEAYYDSISVVPKIAPGAENACGIATLLQLAKVLTQERRPKYSVMFLATSAHFQGLAGINNWLYRHARQFSKFYDARLSEKEKIKFRLFLGLDLSSHNDQVAAFSEGTFYNYRWRTDNYKMNALSPVAKKFLEYYEAVFPPAPDEVAKAKARDTTYLETRRYLNAVTPSKRSWRHYMHTPLGLDNEAVTWVGHFGLALATAHDIREKVDTPLDTIENLNIPNVTAQARVIAALLLKATQDENFFPDTKLKFKDWGHSLKGNIYLFDRSVNFFVPKAPIGGALVTYDIPAERATWYLSRSGVRGTMVAMTTKESPHGGTETRGYEVENITSGGERIRVYAWDENLIPRFRNLAIAKKEWRKYADKVKEAKVIVATREGTFEYPMYYDYRTGKFSAMINLERKVRSWGSIIWAGIICGILLAVFLLILKLVSDMPPQMVTMLRLLSIGTVVFFVLWLGNVWYFHIKHDPRIRGFDPNRRWDHRTIEKIVLRGENSEYVVKNVDVSYGAFKGQFIFDIRRHRWTIKPSAYELDEYGRIVKTTDLGQEGDKSYPLATPFGWWETNMIGVVFPCRALSIFETVDSRYLSSLDWVTLLGRDDSQLQWFAIDQIVGQSRVEGRTTNAAVVYAKPGERVKILMSTGLLGVKYLLTNAPEEYFEKPVKKVTDEIKKRARGKGYLIDAGVIYLPAYEGTKDMWILDDVRLKELAQYGIRNNRLEQLHSEAREALLKAKEYLEKRNYSKFMTACRRAWGLEARGYPDVKSTANDTVRGIVFYFILLIPFSFFMERLIYGTPDIRKRVAAFAAIFVAVFMILRFVHPAFKLSTSPYIIFLAFVIFALGSIVLFFLMSKFNQEVQKIKRASSGIYEVDVGRLSATLAAVLLGISNLRKRKLRTTLTATTLVLLTFTVLSFTSVQTSLTFYRLPRDNKPPYQGCLIRDRSWKGLQPSVLDYLYSAFKDRAYIIAPRAWRIAKIQDEKEYIKFTVPSTGKTSYANGFVGFTPEESRVTGIDQFLIGEKSRWFKEGDEKVCIMPSDMAELVDITPEDVGEVKVKMLGEEFTVIGIIDSDRFNNMFDMDDEKMTPVDTVSEGQRMRKEKSEDPNLLATEPIETFVHLEASNIMLLPYSFLMRSGGTLRSIAITHFRNPNFIPDIEEFMKRVALTVFVGEGDSVVVYSSIGRTNLKGMSNLIVPIMIAALIVLNTMLGAVYERFREIGIYSSVGLAPNHIAALFLAESAVFATVGAVLGYLLGQSLTLALSHFGYLKGMNLNYSSLSAISSTLVVMATVFLSTLYPAKKASDMSVPDVTRRWKFPEPEGDLWKFDFPFTVGGAEVVGMYAYLARVFESYGEGSTGGFVAENVKLAPAPKDSPADYTITMRTWLAPYDLGISQDVRLDAIPTGEYNIYRIEVTLRRLSGDVASWRRINRGFLNVLRKRFLVWRTIAMDEKVNYQKLGRQQLGLAPAPAAGAD